MKEIRRTLLSTLWWAIDLAIHITMYVIFFDVYIANIWLVVMQALNIGIAGGMLLFRLAILYGLNRKYEYIWWDSEGAFDGWKGLGVNLSNRKSLGFYYMAGDHGLELAYFSCEGFVETWWVIRQYMKPLNTYGNMFRGSRLYRIGPLFVTKERHSY